MALFLSSIFLAAITKSIPSAYPTVGPGNIANEPILKQEECIAGHLEYSSYYCKLFIIGYVTDKWFWDWDIEDDGDFPVGDLQSQLVSIFGLKVSIILHNGANSKEETGVNEIVTKHGGLVSVMNHYYGQSFRFVYLPTTSSKNEVTGEQLNEFLDEEFGWAHIGDMEKLEQAVNRKINHKFKGKWGVFIRKQNDDDYLGFQIEGGYYKHPDGYHIFVLKY